MQRQSEGLVPPDFTQQQVIPVSPAGFFIPASEDTVSLSVGNSWLKYPESGAAEGKTLLSRIRLSFPQDTGLGLRFAGVKCSECIAVIDTPYFVELGEGTTKAVIKVQREDNHNRTEVYGQLHVEDLGEVLSLTPGEQNVLTLSSHENKYYDVKIGRHRPQSGLSTEQNSKRSQDDPENEDADPLEMMYFVSGKGSALIELQYLRTGDWEEWKTFTVHPDQSVVVSLTGGSNLIKLCGSFKLVCKLRLKLRPVNANTSTETQIRILVGIVYNNTVKMKLNFPYKVPLVPEWHYQFILSTQDWKESIVGLSCHVYSTQLY